MKRMKRGLAAVVMMISVASSATENYKLIPEDRMETRWTLDVTMGAKSELFISGSSSTTIIHGFKSMQDCMKIGNRLTQELDAATVMISSKITEDSVAQFGCRKTNEHKLEGVN